MLPVFIEKTLGYLLRNFRGRDYDLILNLPDFDSIPRKIELTSDDFKDGEMLPLTTAALGVGDNKSPSLSWALKEELPGLSSYAIVVQDVDPPVPFAIAHLCAYGVPTTVNSFKLGELTGEPGKSSKENVKFGYGVFGRLGYSGPRPVLNHGPHRYYFQIFALNEKATEELENLSEIPKLEKLKEVMKGNVLGYGSIIGKYERKA